MASGACILSDIVDLSADRGHPTRRNRPFASGRIKLWQGFVAAPLLILGGLVGGFLLSAAFATTMLSYLIVALAYAFARKRTALVDVIAPAFLCTLRLIMGAVLAGVLLSQWLMVVSMLLFVSLSLAKRHAEALRRVSAGEQRVANRSYRAEDVTLTLGLGLATATAAPLRADTDYAVVLPDRDIVRTDWPVTIVQGGSRLTGVGMEIDNRTRQLQVNSQVRAVVLPPTPAGATSREGAAR
jgi:4-hydroxybenzoate polyprenyltransferase